MYARYAKGMATMQSWCRRLSLALDSVLRAAPVRALLHMVHCCVEARFPGHGLQAVRVVSAASISPAFQNPSAFVACGEETELSHAERKRKNTGKFFQSHFFPFCLLTQSPPYPIFCFFFFFLSGTA